VSDSRTTVGEPLYFHWRCGFIPGFLTAAIPSIRHPEYAFHPSKSRRIAGFASALRLNDPSLVDDAPPGKKLNVVVRNLYEMKFPVEIKGFRSRR
jgi:hypothetical protein